MNRGSFSALLAPALCGGAFVIIELLFYFALRLREQRPAKKMGGQGSYPFSLIRGTLKNVDP
jgi:hypothetical protein